MRTAPFPRSTFLVLLLVAAALAGALAWADDADDSEPGKPAWAEQAYRPGSAPGRDPEPDKARTTPKWRGHSGSAPYDVALEAKELIVATGTDEAPAQGRRSWKLIFPQPTNTFTVVPTLDFGHERFKADPDAKLAPSDQAGAAGLDSQARAGSRSLRLEKRTIGGELRLTSEPFDLQPGEDYLLEGFYHVHAAEFGAAVQLAVEILDGNGRVAKRCRDSYASPLRYTAPDDWLRTFTRFRTPGSARQGRVVITSRGSESTVAWDDIRLSGGDESCLPAGLSPGGRADAHRLGWGRDLRRQRRDGAPRDHARPAQDAPLGRARRRDRSFLTVTLSPGERRVWNSIYPSAKRAGSAGCPPRPPPHRPSSNTARNCYWQPAC